MSVQRRAESVTMHDVAALAGVSIKTVSNVVNGYPYIRPTTRAKVEAAIAELGYQVNISARNLRQGRTGMIGLALPELSLAYFAELADLVIKAAEAHGLTVLIEPTGGVRERELEVLSGARRRLTDGLIFSPLALGQQDVELLRVDFPLVLLGERIFGGPVDHVTMRNIEAARAGTEYLIDLGRSRVAAIGAHPGEEVGSAGLRLKGYLQALAGRGIPVDERLIGAAGLWHRANGAAAMQRMLDDGVVPDGVFAFNDTLAMGVMHVLQVRGLRIPEDVAVVGFDDIDDAKYSLPTLTSISPGKEEIAVTAVDLLAGQIAARPVEREPVERLAAFRLVVRESSERAPAGTQSGS